MKTYIGIDPGSLGFISVLHPSGEREYLSIKDSSAQELAAFLQEKKQNSAALMAIMEEVHSVHGSSAAATFSFGEINGILKGILTALKIPYSLVQPKEWQNCIWINQDKVYKAGKVNPKTGKVSKVIDTKPTSMNAATRLFPEIDFRRSPSCKKLDDNKVDSVLICEYARRNNL